jgi:threonine/homoserine/homoserine lactone efflux protein
MQSTCAAPGRVSFRHEYDAEVPTVEALRAFLFGVTIAAPVGPIALLLIHTGLNHRLSVALSGALGVALADLTYALAALSAGSGLAALLRGHRASLQVAASVLLIALGLWLAISAWRRPRAGHGSAVGPPTLIRLYLLTLANPLTVLLFVGFSGQMTVAGGMGAVLYAALFLFAGSLAVQVGYASFGAVLQRWVSSPDAVRAFNTASGLAVAAFGVYGLWSRG